MRRILFIHLVFLIALFGLQNPISALDISVDGYYRIRSIYIKNLFLDKDTYPDTGFLMTRLRLEPTGHVMEGLDIKAQIDLLDDVILGNNNTLQGRTAVLKDELSVSTREDARIDALDIKRIWAEWSTPIGMLRVGRQSEHWGLGILANHGEGFDDDFGDNHGGSTKDRILFATKPLGKDSPLLIGLLYDKMDDAPLKPADYDREKRFRLSRTDDDVDQYGQVVEYLGEENTIGLFTVQRFQKFTNTKAYVFDIFIKLKFHNIYCNSEVVTIRGSTDTWEAKGGTDIQTLGGILEIGVAPGNLDTSLEIGYNSGDDMPTDKDFKTFPFHEDHNVGLLLFEEAIPNYQTPLSDLFGNKGQVFNCIYLYPVARYQMGRLLAKAALLWARADKLFANDAGDEVSYGGNTENPSRDLGLEIDVGLKYSISEDLNLGLQMGYFLPGETFKAIDGSNPDPSFTAQGRLTITF